MFDFTDSSDRGTVPADIFKSRRAALGGLASLPALALPAVAEPAGDLDAPLFDLLDRWRAACARSLAADRRFWEADDAADVAPPAALLVTKADKDKLFTEEHIGRPFSEAAMKYLDAVLPLVAPIQNDGVHLRALVNRYVEIRDAHRQHYAAVEAARRTAGYYEALAEWEAAHAADSALRRQVADARPRTIPGLLAKTAAIADEWGAKALEQDTTFEEGKVVSFDIAALTVLRDCAALMGGEAIR